MTRVTMIAAALMVAGCSAGPGAAAPTGPTTPMTMIQALRSAMDVMLERDPDVVVFGQDVGYFGGVFRCTEGLQKKYGTSRVFDAPRSVVFKAWTDPEHLKRWWGPNARRG